MRTLLTIVKQQVPIELRAVQIWTEIQNYWARSLVKLVWFWKWEAVVVKARSVHWNPGYLGLTTRYYSIGFLAFAFETVIGPQSYLLSIIYYKDQRSLKNPGYLGLTTRYISIRFLRLTAHCCLVNLMVSSVHKLLCATSLVTLSEIFDT